MAVATAPVATPRPAITRSAAHAYTYQGITYPGVTGLLKVIDKSEGLMQWSAKNTAIAALAQLPNLPSLLETVGEDGVIKMLTSRSAWKRDEAGDTGTLLHTAADLIVKGQPAPRTGATVKRIDAIADWWAASGWKLRISEAYVLSTGPAGYGGTLDLLAYDQDGKTVLADWKSGNWVYPETRLQLAAYGDADLIAPVESPAAFAMPKVDRYVVLHVKDDAVRAIELDIDDRDRLAFYSAMEIAAWKARQVGWHL